MKTKAPAPSSDAALALDLFDRVFTGPSWRAWRAWLCAVLGQPMTKAEADIFRRCTGRQTVPTHPARECWTIVGRRGGKSRMAAFLSDFMAASRTYRLAPGERGRVSIVSPSKSQGSIVFEYARKMLEAMPVLQQQIRRQTKDAIDLPDTSIVIQSASFRTPRGFTNVGAVCEEIAFWRDETGAN